jgi:proteasome lid subunit RPN8/RPN11
MSEIFFLKGEAEVIALLKREGDSNLLCEVCGFLGIDDEGRFVYERMPNRSKNPEQYFIIDPYDYLSFINKNKLLAIFHSHLVGDETPSEFDKMTSENCCFPFIIYSVMSEKFFIYEPQYKDYDVNIIKGIRNII